MNLDFWTMFWAMLPALLMAAIIQEFIIKPSVTFIKNIFHHSKRHMENYIEPLMKK